MILVSMERWKIEGGRRDPLNEDQSKKLRARWLGRGKWAPDSIRDSLQVP